MTTIEDTNPITAGCYPVKPPRAWFDDPQLDGPTPIVVTADGRVYGHCATWNRSHIGLPGGVKPPRSKTNYAFFRTGAVETDDGSLVDVGQITLVGGHAPLEASTAQAVAHYDNTNSAVCDVAAGEDRYGIWVAGSLRPTVDDEQLRTLRASSVSGDWRPINGNLELVAICSVNVPGFPIPRARVAGGQPLALIAAGVEPLVAARLREYGDQEVRMVVDMTLERMARLEALVASGEITLPDSKPKVTVKRGRKAVEAAARRRREAEAVTAAADVDRRRERAKQRAATRRLRARVASARAPQPTPDELRARVASFRQSSADELRARVASSRPQPDADALRARVASSRPQPSAESLRRRVHSS